MICENCGMPLPKTGFLCSNCGALMTKEQIEMQKKHKPMHQTDFIAKVYNPDKALYEKREEKKKRFGRKILLFFLICLFLFFLLVYLF